MLLIGVFVGVVVMCGLLYDVLCSWGWCVLFVFGLLIGLIGFYICCYFVDFEVFLYV